ncbi:MAG: polyprenol phosphomannose-dependent alpha 1,6 mannosyltransferase MptB [Micromonosporaceae bacterium]|nr:polyprenol phosphomannose-dependent alpha 1,6 mannosyltransferase MptB [Micromonosporaceae bacterium]
MAHTTEPQTRNPTTAGRLATCRRLGLAGSVALLLGGIFAGIPPKSDPLLQHPDLLQLRAFITPTVALVYGGLCLLMVAWWRLGTLVRSPTKPTQRELIITFAWWGAPLLVTIPIFSTDVYSYIAQGTMTVVGVDAYHQGPRILSGQWAVDIPDIWHTTPAPYGPVFLSLAAAVSLVTGGSVWLGVLGMRLLALVGIALVIAAIPRLSRLAGVDPAYGLWLGVLNPVVLVHLVGDAHNDAIMIGLMMAGLTLAVERRPAAGAVLVTLGALVKAPAGLALAFIVGVWAAQLHGRARYPRAALAVGAISATTVVVTTWLAGTGYGWVSALGTPTLARTWTSITTDLGYLTGFLLEQTGLGTRNHALAFWQYAGLAVAAVVCVLMLRRHRTNPVLGVGLGLGAVVFLAPVFHPWYMLWATVPLGAAATSPRTRKIVVGLIVVMTVLVFPGGIPAGVPAVAGLLIGCLLVLGTTWAVANLDRTDLAGSTRAALRGLAPTELLRRLREEWREPKGDGPPPQPVGLR